MLDRLEERTAEALVVSPLGCCHVWVGRLNRNGYGRFRVRGVEEMAHRLSYELRVGPIPEGLVLDHLCRVRCCVNPAHLEPVTIRENTLRGKARLFGR